MTTYQQLPPSPPPSPPKRRHKKHHSDPFLELSSTPLSSPPPSSPPNEPEEAQDSIVTRILITPILFTSFLLSLFFVNLSDRRRRTAQHPHSPRILDYLSPGAWLDPEPYQDPHRSTWDRRDSASHVEPHGAISPRAEQKKKKQRSWYLNKKIRKMARMEIGDAFEMRARIIVLMLSAVVCFVAGAIMGVRWVLTNLWWWGS